ncbi:hypothetical protein ABZX39_32575 [Streptomyces collinus]|uniref:hypothetical protein n=1 Tax=Streptomyces collinus TaxID=42684 RepID=UPI0033BC2367
MQVQVRPDTRATGQRSWFVRMQCRPDTASSLAAALATRDDVFWVNITSGGSEIICLARGAADQGGGSILRRLPRTSQVLAFTAFTAFTVLHVHTGSGTRWLTLDDPLTPAQTAALQAGARPHPTSPLTRSTPTTHPCSPSSPVTAAPASPRWPALPDGPSPASPHAWTPCCPPARSKSRPTSLPPSSATTPRPTCG